MKTKLIQILYDMRHQPVIAWVTFIATALSIFLIMVVVMMQQVGITPFAPESCRDRLLLGAYLHLTDIGDSQGDASAGLTFHSARILYSDLEGVERVSYFCIYKDDSDVKGPQSDAFAVQSRKVDAEFFNIFDHPLVAGRYFTPDEANSLLPVAVITESTARRALGDTEWAGAKILIDQKDYTVVGVVNDNSTLATTASGDIFLPTAESDPSVQWDEYLGAISAALLVKDGVDFQSVRDQVKARYSTLDTELAPKGKKTVYHEAPFDQETIATGLHGSNITPDKNSGRNMRLAIYAILLIVPAINLSSMLHSRMRRRISEIGVRRAFGCTRSRIIADIISENFIVTLIGGIVGVTLGVIFASTYSGLYENMDNFGRGDTPAINAIVNWTTILTAIGICFLLNIISASIPAWQASRLNPVNAINSK